MIKLTSDMINAAAARVANEINKSSLIDALTKSELCEIRDVPVLYQPDMLMMSGLACAAGCIPFMGAGEAEVFCILVDDYFMKMDPSTKMWLCFHEIGHYTLGHMSDEAVETTASDMTVNARTRIAEIEAGKLNRLEIEADNYAYSIMELEKSIHALEYVYSLYPDRFPDPGAKEILLRIDKIRNTFAERKKKMRHNPASSFFYFLI